MCASDGEANDPALRFGHVSHACSRILGGDHRGLRSVFHAPQCANNQTSEITTPQLDFIYQGDIDMPRFFVDRLEAPSLSTLHLISDFDTMEIDLAPQPHYLLKFFRRDGSSLTALKLNIPHLEELLVEAVRLLPSLENLEISMMMQGTVSTTLIMLLLEQKCEDNGGEFVLCPRLAHIRFPPISMASRVQWTY